MRICRLITSSVFIGSISITIDEATISCNEPITASHVNKRCQLSRKLLLCPSLNNPVSHTFAASSLLMISHFPSPLSPYEPQSARSSASSSSSPPPPSKIVSASSTMTRRSCHSGFRRCDWGYGGRDKVVIVYWVGIFYLTWLPVIGSSREIVGHQLQLS